MSKIHFNNTFSNGCVQFMAADWPATTAHKMIYLLISYTVLQARREKRGKAPLPRAEQVAAKRRKELLEKLAAQKKAKKLEEQIFS